MHTTPSVIDELQTSQSRALRFTSDIATGAHGRFTKPDPKAEIPIGRACYAWSEEEDAAHELFEKHAAEIAMKHRLQLGIDFELHTDFIGNTFFTVFGTDELSEREARGNTETQRSIDDYIPLTPGIILGSHLDSTPNGGVYDGVLGVGAGLQALEEILRKGKPKKNITVVAWRGEESSPNNGIACLGSQIACGLLSDEKLEGIIYTKGEDGENIKFLDRIAKKNGISKERVLAGINEMRRNPLVTKERFSHALELHIEQSAVIETQGTDLGIVDGGIGGARREVWEDRVESQEIDTIRYRKVTLNSLGIRGHTGGLPPNPTFSKKDLKAGERFYRNDALVGLALVMERLGQTKNPQLISGIKVSKIGFKEPLNFTSIPDDVSCELFVPNWCYEDFEVEMHSIIGETEKSLGTTIMVSAGDASEGMARVVSLANANSKLSVPLEIARNMSELGQIERGQEGPNGVGKSRATVIDFQLDPTSSSVNFNLDYRHSGEEKTFESVIESVQEKVLKNLDISGTHSIRSYTLSTQVSSDVVELLKDVAQKSGFLFTVMPSLPGHDAAILGKVGIKVGMVFVRHDGVSHNPREYMDPENFIKPFQVFLSTLEQLANE